MADIKMYLTSLEPDMSQTIYSQSLGGYISTSLVYPETTLSSSVGLYDSSIALDTPSEGTWDRWSGIEYINIGQEVIKVSPISNGVVSVVERGYNGITNMHMSGDDVRAISSKELFNDVFNSERKQYRCIALKNTSAENNPSDEKFAIETSIHIEQRSLNNNSVIRISVELPKSQYLEGTSSSWSSILLRDSSLAGLYDDDFFKDAYLKIAGGDYVGQGRSINSYDGDTGSFVFYSSMPSTYDYTTQVSYEVLPSSSQRIKSGIVSPDTSRALITPFYDASENSSISLKINGFSGTLRPNDICYIWIERTMEKGSAFFDSNFVTFVLTYKTTG
jgi:hypothetical protein